MGQSQSWFMYARDKQDYWIPEPLYSTLMREDDVLHHMGRFKHRFFVFALGQLESVGKLYLYRGRYRQVKCWFDGETLTVDFSTEESLKAWSDTRRSKKGLDFDLLFTQQVSESKWKLQYKKEETL